MCVNRRWDKQIILSQHYFPSLRDGKYNLRDLMGISDLEASNILRTCGPTNGYFADIAADVGPQNTHRRSAKYPLQSSKRRPTQSTIVIIIVLILVLTCC